MATVRTTSSPDRCRQGHDAEAADAASTGATPDLRRVRSVNPVSEWSSTWTRPIQDAIRVDRSKLALVRTGRCALGIAVSLVVGDVSGHLLVGVGGAVGALTAGVASLQGTYRSRVKSMAFVAAAVATSALVGATVSRL